MRLSPVFYFYELNTKPFAEIRDLDGYCETNHNLLPFISGISTSRNLFCRQLKLSSDSKLQS